MYPFCCGSVARISPRSTCSGESRPVTVLTVVQDRAHNLQWVEKLDPGVHPQILCCHTRETTISGLASLDLCPKTWRSYIIELLRYEVFRRVGAFWVIGVYLYIYIYIYIHSRDSAIPGYSFWGALTKRLAWTSSALSLLWALPAMIGVWRDTPQFAEAISSGSNCFQNCTTKNHKHFISFHIVRLNFCRGKQCPMCRSDTILISQLLISLNMPWNNIMNWCKLWPWQGSYCFHHLGATSTVGYGSKLGTPIIGWLILN